MEEATAGARLCEGGAVRLVILEDHPTCIDRFTCSIQRVPLLGSGDEVLPPNTRKPNHPPPLLCIWVAQFSPNAACEAPSVLVTNVSWRWKKPSRLEQACVKAAPYMWLTGRAVGRVQAALHVYTRYEHDLEKEKGGDAMMARVGSFKGVWRIPESEDELLAFFFERQTPENKKRASSSFSLLEIR
ncbi:hypothetical protein R5R35_014177 [Gryllus longicercus]|uniref:Uncharacterized protein n=1 Tax=Gryllus longicercus TaxID=2509291 RepID=A0AAN9VPE4_9ORTH